MLNLEPSERDAHVLGTSLGSSEALWRPPAVRLVFRVAGVALLVAGFAYSLYLLYAFLRGEFWEMMQAYVFSKIGSRWPR